MTPSGRLDAIGHEIVDRHHALPADYAPPDLVPVSPGYEPGRTYELRREAADAWMKMHAAARDAGIELRVVSAYRSYERQQAVFDDAVKRMGPEQDSVARPGHSEHQLGTALDIAGADNDTVLKASFGETEAGRWLAEHAPAFGFAVSYTEANRAATGYTAEPWHYRYVGAAARERHEAAIRGK
jgi:D-alanyl-D-alanine carboxypeptidase